MGERDAREVELALHELSRKELVRPARQSSMEGEAEYAFWHVLVRDVAYGQIPRASRARKHGGAATWMEAKAGERVEDLADVLAYHYSEALELARAAGGDGLADEVLPDARRMLALAGDRRRSLDQPRADSFYRRALDLYEPDDLEQAPLLVKAGRVAVALSRSGRSGRESSGDLYRSAGDELGLAEALLDLSRYVAYRGKQGGRAGVPGPGAAAGREASAGAGVRVLLGIRAGNDMMAGRAAECVASADAAIAMANELGMSEVVARALQFRGVARTELGDLGGLDDLREAIELRLEAAQALAAGIGYLNLADATWASVGAQEGLELHETAQAFAESRGLHIRSCGRRPRRPGCSSISAAGTRSSRSPTSVARGTRGRRGAGTR